MSYNSNDDIIPIICFLLCLLCFGLGLWVGVSTTEKEAVKNGCATWVANEKGGADFKWNTEINKK